MTHRETWQRSELPKRDYQPGQTHRMRFYGHELWAVVVEVTDDAVVFDVEVDGPIHTIEQYLQVAYDALGRLQETRENSRETQAATRLVGEALALVRRPAREYYKPTMLEI
jgi:hypothetical protein